MQDVLHILKCNISYCQYFPKLNLNKQYYTVTVIVIITEKIEQFKHKLNNF